MSQKRINKYSNRPSVHARANTETTAKIKPLILIIEIIFIIIYG